MKPNNERPLARNPNQVQSLLAIACGIILLFSFRSAYAADIPCDELETAGADELLATVDPKSIPDGEDVRVGEYGCDNYPGQKVCDWKTTLEDDRMLDPDHRLIYVLSSHQTGSGSWEDLLVFGCVSERLKGTPRRQEYRGGRQGLKHSNRPHQPLPRGRRQGTCTSQRPRAAYYGDDAVKLKLVRPAECWVRRSRPSLGSQIAAPAPAVGPGRHLNKPGAAFLVTSR